MIDVYGQIAACYVKRRALYQLSYEGLCRDDNGYVSRFRSVCTTYDTAWGKRRARKIIREVM